MYSKEKWVEGKEYPQSQMSTDICDPGLHWVRVKQINNFMSYIFLMKELAF